MFDASGPIETKIPITLVCSELSTASLKGEASVDHHFENEINREHRSNRSSRLQTIELVSFLAWTDLVDTSFEDRKIGPRRTT